MTKFAHISELMFVFTTRHRVSYSGLKTQSLFWRSWIPARVTMVGTVVCLFVWCSFYKRPLCLEEHHSPPSPHCSYSFYLVEHWNHLKKSFVTHIQKAYFILIFSDWAYDWTYKAKVSTIDTCTTHGGTCIHSHDQCGGYKDVYALGCNKNSACC